MSFESNGNVLEIKNADKVKFVGTSNTVIDNLTGRIGVGIDEPTSALDVNGDVEFRSNVQFGTEMSITNFDVKSNVQIGTDTMNNTLTVNGAITKTQYNPGEIIEELHGVCNGTSLHGRAGMQEVTTSQGSTDSYVDISGSVITNYLPPIGTKMVVYEFQYQMSRKDGHTISNLKLFYSVDGGTNWVEVTDARSANSGTHRDNKYISRWVFELGSSSPDSDMGAMSNVRPNLGFKWVTRRHNESHDYILHATEYWDGGGTDQFSRPTIMIKAIA